MPVTLNSTGITFSNGQTLATSSPTGTIGAIQYTAYQSGTFGGYQNQPATDTQVPNSLFLGLYPGYSYFTSSQIIVGSTYYRSANVVNFVAGGADTGGADAGTIFWRTAYRTVNGL